MHAGETSTKNPRANGGLDAVFCRLLQVALGVAHDFPYTPSEDEWQSLFQMARQQCVLGVAYNAIPLLPQASRPPRRITLNWSCAAETMRGVNRLINQEAARYTGLFAERGLRSAILKGAANARLYPDPLSREGGDVDIWVPGGRERLTGLLVDMELVSGPSAVERISRHIGFQGENGVHIEVHFRAADVLHRNNEFQALLNAELEDTALTPEGFYSPSIRFALIMQLAHLYGHSFSGIGLKQYMDYFILLMHSTEDDRAFARQQVQRFHLVHACAAIMYVLEKVFALPRGLMICPPDARRGTRLYRLTMAGGNFGRYNPDRVDRRFVFRRWFSDRVRALSWVSFDPVDAVLRECRYWRNTILLMPERIRRKKIGL